jgi:hypothetical protein
VLATVLFVLLLTPRQLPPADAALIKAADAALAFAPVSVMDKAVMPPSGDKHDYMSQAPYWWPDPSKPGGLPYVQRDGERNPEINRISDHDNLGRLIGHVSTLARAYDVTHDERYTAHAARLVRTWFLDPATRMNPHLQFGQGIPGITEGRGIGIIETRDLPRLLDAVGRLTGSKTWSSSDETGLQSWMRTYLQWLIESPHGVAESKNGNNHETWYDVQVAGLAIYTKQSEIAKRTLEGAKARIARQIEPDGRQPRELSRTRSWDYSIFNLTAFFDLASMGERAGVDLWNYRTPDGRSLRGAFEFLLPFANGERPWTGRQITPFSESALHPLQRRAAAAWKNPNYLPRSTGKTQPTEETQAVETQRKHRDTVVSDAAALRAAIAAAKPGDIILMKDGTWTDVQIMMDTPGTSAAPITLRAATPGAVVLNGSSTLTFAAPHVRIEGLHFKGGTLRGGTVIRFASDHASLSDSAISDYNPPAGGPDYHWVMFEGSGNTVDRSSFQRKTNHRPMVSNRAGARRNAVTNSHFKEFTWKDTNGGETIQIMGYGMSEELGEDGAFFTLERNLFEATHGEGMEIVSIKSNRNRIRSNTFLRTKGGITNRSGNFNVIEDNIILGGKEPRSYGIRVTGQHHKVVNNYVADVDGSCLLLVAGEYIEKALTPDYQPILREGTPLGRVPRYAQVKHGVFENNTFVNCGAEPVVIGSSLKAGWPQAQRILMPEDNRIERNAVRADAPANAPTPLTPADVGPSWMRR